MGDAATPVLPDFTSQTAAAYKANIDAGFAVADRIAWAFAPHEQSTPDMTVRLDAGSLFDGTTLTEKAAQSTGTITAPTTNPRIDRVSINIGSGAVAVTTGTEAPSPSPPAIPANNIPVAQVVLVVSQTSIVNADITDERHLSVPLNINNLTQDTGPDLAADFVATYDASAAALKKVLLNKIGGFDSGTLMLFQQTAAPTGWTKQTTHNDKSLRVVSGAAGSGGATAFSSVFGSGKVSGSHTLTEAEMPAHTHNAGTSNSAATGDTAPQNFRNTATGNLATSSTGGSGGHTHTLSLDLQFVDLIIASKD